MTDSPKLTQFFDDDKNNNNNSNSSNNNFNNALIRHFILMTGPQDLHSGLLFVHCINSYDIG